MPYSLPFSKYISWPILIASFTLGLAYAVFGQPAKKVVTVYPSMQNHETHLFQDQAEQCFEMKPRKVKCTADAQILAPQ
jgi:hypothetical protein